MFGVYGAAGRALGGRARQLRLSEVFCCGALAGGCNALVLTPVELVRNRLQVARGAGPSVRAVVEAAVRADGKEERTVLAKLLQRFLPLVLRQVSVYRRGADVQLLPQLHPQTPATQTTPTQTTTPNQLPVQS